MFLFGAAVDLSRRRLAEFGAAVAVGDVGWGTICLRVVRLSNICIFNIADS